MMNNITPDYKNGYNDCVEMLLRIIKEETKVAKDGESSINDHLRNVTRRILETSFNELKPKPQVLTREYLHGVEL